jgi:ATP-dependent DNA helicase RecG
MEQLSFSFETPSTLLAPDDIFGLSDDSELLRRLKESRQWERKPPGIHPRALGEYFSMWANTSPDGGLVAVGIEDNGEISGCHRLSQNQVNALEKSGYVYCSEARSQSKLVQVTAEDGYPSFVILFRVFYREDKIVIDSSGHAFVRVGDEKHKLTIDEVRELQIDKGQLDFEQEPSHLDFPGDFSGVLIKRFIDRLKELRGLSGGHSDAELLAHRHLGRFSKGTFVPSNSCTLLFAKDPLGGFPGCRVRFLRVEGEVELSGKDYNIVQSKFIEGPIPQLIDESAKVIESQLRDFSRWDESGKFFSAPEYPKGAWCSATIRSPG